MSGAVDCVQLFVTDNTTSNVTANNRVWSVYLLTY